MAPSFLVNADSVAPGNNSLVLLCVLRGEMLFIRFIAALYGTVSLSEKLEQIGIELIFVRVGKTVRGTRVNLQGRVLDEFGRSERRGANRHDLVVVAMDDQCWHVEFFKIIGEIRLGKRLDAVELVLEAALHPLEPERVADALADLRTRPVSAIEGCRKILEELRTIGGHAGTNVVEYLDRQAAGIGVRLEHVRRYGAHQYSPGDALGTVAADVAGDFSTAGRMADQGDAPQIERFDKLRQVVGVSVHFVAVPGLARTSVATTIMGNAAIAVGSQENHLAFPGIGIERPAVAEDNGLSRAPVLIVNFCAVFGGDCAHGGISYVVRIRLQGKTSGCFKTL